jgi:hypothetical protein
MWETLASIHLLFCRGVCQLGETSLVSNQASVCTRGVWALLHVRLQVGFWTNLTQQSHNSSAHPFALDWLQTQSPVTCPKLHHAATTNMPERGEDDKHRT